MAARERCAHCQRPLPECYCQRLKRVDNDWPVHILQHPVESRHALGTARIAHLGLSNCTLEVNPRFSAQNPDIGTGRLALVYPGQESQPLSALLDEPPCTLVFIDATWRKSRRMLLESHSLMALPRFSLTDTPPSRYRIRKEAAAGALSTLEAVVYSLALLERNREKYLPLLQIMDALIDEQIQHMGAITYTRNYHKL